MSNNLDKKSEHFFTSDKKKSLRPKVTRNTLNVFFKVEEIRTNLQKDLLVLKNKIPKDNVRWINFIARAETKMKTEPLISTTAVSEDLPPKRSEAETSNAQRL